MSSRWRRGYVSGAALCEAGIYDDPCHDCGEIRGRFHQVDQVGWIPFGQSWAGRRKVRRRSGHAARSGYESPLEEIMVTAILEGRARAFWDTAQQGPGTGRQ